MICNEGENVSKYQTHEKQLSGQDHVRNQYAMLSRPVAKAKDYKAAIKTGSQENKISKVGKSIILQSNERLIQQESERLEGVIDTLKKKLQEVE